jgi:CheY-like chemotaxis protein
MLAVSDTGTGMPPEIVARAFEPFFTTKSEGEGTGLGLSQVFGWVKQSGGHIKIYSELGHGTTVKLYLPRASEDGRRDDQASGEEVDGHGSETILLVEDNPHVRRTAVRQLTDLGYSVIEAEQAEGALQKIRSGEPFDLLLTDVVMPGGMSGYELAAAAEGLQPGIKVLFTSGYTELAANGLRRSRKGPLISKPYSKSDLGRAIRSALDRPPGGKS